MDEQLLKADEEARVDALDVERSFIVQAPAGSGKTELLIQRYLNLLAVVDEPEEVIAITFTRKATAEMQVRVLDSLRRAARRDVPEKDHERKTYELALAALDKSAALDWHLVSNPRRMRILTMDSLNASIARSQPLTTAGTGARIVTGAELQNCYEAAALATLDWLAEEGVLQQATAEVLGHVDNNTWLYTSYLARMLATRDQWLPFIGSGLRADDPDVEQGSEVLRERFEASICQSVTAALKRTRKAILPALDQDSLALFDYAATNLLNEGAADSPIVELSGLTELPAATPEALHIWRGIAELLLTKTGYVRKTVNKNQGFPPGDKDKKGAMVALLEDLAEDPGFGSRLAGVLLLPPVTYSDEQWRVLLALFQLLPIAVADLKRLFAERGISDHAEIALSADDALGSADNPGDIALLLDYQVRHLLVDEMQDTSAAQYRMLDTLTAGWEAGDGRTLYCVGDPMQSIYRFRNAEVGQFLLARQHGIGTIALQPLLLRRNFRSGENLVHWFNTVFTTLLAPADDPMRGAVSYSEAVPVPQLAGAGRCFTHAVFGADKDAEAAVGCSVIKATLDENPQDAMTVLVRGRTQLPGLLQHLRKAGIAYRAIDIDRLTDLAEVIEVLALTRAAAHVGDRIAWLAILRAPWIGLQWADLHALVRNDSGSSIWELVQDRDRRDALSAPGREALEGALDILSDLVQPRRSRSLREVVERTWFLLGGPGLLADSYALDNVDRYFDVLQSIETAGSLLDVAELESVLDQERVSSDANARLQIMTMHKAKGLQFEHVLLFGLGRAPGQSGRGVLSWFDLPDQHGREQKIISPVGPRADLEKDPLHQYIEAVEAEKDAHEQGRLLYVACTRAQKTLHLVGHTTLSKDGATMRPPRKNSLLHLLWPAVEPEFVRQFDAEDCAGNEVEPSTWPEPQLRRFKDPWSLPEPGMPGADATVTDIGDGGDNDLRVEFYWVGTEARIAGTLVHRWLQQVTENDAVARDFASLDLDKVTTRWLAETGIDEQAAPAIVGRVRQAIQAAMQDEQGRWLLSGEGYTELALTGLVHDELASVVIDRVRIDDHGTHWIIDYKTSSHEGGNLKGFLDAEVQRYREQLQRYATIYQAWSGQEPKCALYFPLLQAFVEVS